MHGMHARVPKNFVLEERIERYSSAIEIMPEHLAGRWAWACHPLESTDPLDSYREVRLDLGCGKGAFAAAMAASHPDVLFVCVDAEPVAVVYAAQKAVEQALSNMVVIPALGADLTTIFATGELACVYLNFPTPYPRVRDAHKRLVIVDRLLELRHVLAPRAILCLRTDSLPLRDFALTQLDLAGFEVLELTDDARRCWPELPESEYESMTVRDGATVFGIRATAVGEDPTCVVQTAPLSLVDYLPQNLESMTYVPRGMEGTVTNLRNYRAKRKA